MVMTAGFRRALLPQLFNPRRLRGLQFWLDSDQGVFAGGAGQFTAANNEFLSIASNASLQTGDIDFTCAAWVYLDSKTTYRFIAAKDGGSTIAGDREWAMVYDSALDRFVFNVFLATDSIKQAVAGNLGVPATGAWYFIVGWHDAAANTVNIQVNNGTVNSVATTGALQAAADAAF